MELFRQVPNVFAKIMKSPCLTNEHEALDMLTLNVFPLLSQILMLSEDQVQNEGVKALLKIVKENLPK